MTQIIKRSKNAEIINVDNNSRTMQFHVSQSLRDSIRFTIQFPESYPDGTPKFIVDSKTSKSRANEIQEVYYSNVVTAPTRLSNVLKFLDQTVSLKYVPSSSFSESQSSSEEDSKRVFSGVGKIRREEGDNVPYPRLCGAFFSLDGKLITFFSPIPHPSNRKFFDRRDSSPYQKNTAIFKTQQPRLLSQYAKYREFLVERGQTQPAQARVALSQEKTGKNVEKNFVDWFDSDDEEEDKSKSLPSLFWRPKINAPTLLVSNFLEQMFQKNIARQTPVLERADTSFSLLSNVGTPTSEDPTNAYGATVTIFDCCDMLPVSSKLASRYTVNGNLFDACIINRNVSKENNRAFIASVWDLASLACKLTETTTNTIIPPNPKLEKYIPLHKRKPKQIMPIDKSHPMYNILFLQLLEYLALIGDYQTLTLLSHILLKADIISKREFQAYKKQRIQYADFLHSLSEINEAAKFTVDNLVHSGLEISRICANCNENCIDNYCMKCDLKSIIWCCFCGLKVGGLGSFCFICSHGGHTGCMKIWFLEAQICCSGCNCKCSFSGL